jgi:hypothetical protein
LRGRFDDAEGPIIDIVRTPRNGSMSESVADEAPIFARHPSEGLFFSYLLPVSGAPHRFRTTVNPEVIHPGRILHSPLVRLQEKA